MVVVVVVGGGAWGFGERPDCQLQSIYFKKATTKTILILVTGGGWGGGRWREGEVRLTMCKVYTESHDQDHFEKFGQSCLNIKIEKITFCFLQHCPTEPLN